MAKNVSFFLLWIQLLFTFVPHSLNSEDYQMHGIEISDPYAYLEEMDSDQTKQWLNKQELKTTQYFNQLAKDRDKILSTLKKNNDFEMRSLPLKVDGKTFYYFRARGKDKYCLCMKDQNAHIQTLVDPDEVKSEDNVSLAGFQLSPSNRYLYYGLKHSGSDFVSWHFYDLEKEKFLKSQISSSKFCSPIWNDESDGVYYSRWEKGNFGQADQCLGIYFHALLDSTDENDPLIVKNLNPSCKMINTVENVSTGKYLLIETTDFSSDKSGFILYDLKTQKTINLFPEKLALFGFIVEKNDLLYFHTSYKAPNKRVISVPLSSPNLESISEVIGESKDELSYACATKNYFICNYFQDCSSKLSYFSLEGVKVSDIPAAFPADIHLGNLGKNTSSYQKDEVYFSFSNFTTPPTHYSFNINNRNLKLIFEPKPKRDDFVTEQVFFESKDKTRIPMFITYHKKTPLDGKRPTLMWGYGGFGISMPPYYSSHQLTWLEMGGIFVSVNLRGGSEYGTSWHDQGRLDQKQNVFDDFISAAEYLVNNNYTSSSKLAIHGVSNGGLLVGACLVQRPDLFGAAIAQVGVLDMLKFHKYTIGKAWISDFGNPDNPDHFNYLYAYSPYHNVKENTDYPPTLIMTADHDDRVVPLHSYKFTAKLQEGHNGSSEILLRLNRKEGHGSGGGSLNKKLQNDADILAFLKHELMD